MSYQYNEVGDHVKNFRPQCLVLSGSPKDHEDLVHLVSHVTRNNGLMVCGEVNSDNYSTRQSDHSTATAWLRDNKIKAFNCICTGKLWTLTVIVMVILDSDQDTVEGGIIGAMSRANSLYISRKFPMTNAIYYCIGLQRTNH